MDFKKGSLWVLDFQIRDGREQSGLRPAIVLADTKTDLIVVLPLTSNTSALRFLHTLKIKKSKYNNLEKDSIALVFQMQSVDKKRFVRNIGMLESDYLKQIDIMICALFVINCDEEHKR